MSLTGSAIGPGGYSPPAGFAPADVAIAHSPNVTRGIPPVGQVDGSYVLPGLMPPLPADSPG